MTKSEYLKKIREEPISNKTIVAFYCGYCGGLMTAVYLDMLVDCGVGLWWDNTIAGCRVCHRVQPPVKIVIDRCDDQGKFRQFMKIERARKRARK